MENQNGGLPVIKIYNWRVSYHSQMVRLAAVEKGFPFQLVEVDYILGENYEADFVRINPACEIPVLKTGDEIVCGSQEIIDFLDRLAHNGTDADNRPDVQAFRRRCWAIPMTEITLGITRNQHTLDGANLPQISLDRIARRVNRVSVLENKILTLPELSEAYRQKLSRVLQSEALISTPARLQSLLRDLEFYLDDVDLLLRNRSNGNLQEEGWLFGSQFTNADIILACLLARLDLLGLAGRYWDETERLFLADYYRRLKKRPSFQQECVHHIPG